MSRLPKSWHLWSWASWTRYLLQLMWGIPRPVSNSPTSVSYLISHPNRMCPEPPQGDIWNRCLSHMSWLLLIWRSSGSTQSLPRDPKLLTFSLRRRPAILWRKLILTDLVLSVMTYSRLDKRTSLCFVKAFDKSCFGVKHLKIGLGLVNLAFFSYMYNIVGKSKQS